MKNLKQYFLFLMLIAFTISTVSSISMLNADGKKDDDNHCKLANDKKVELDSASEANKAMKETELKALQAKCATECKKDESYSTDYCKTHGKGEETA